MTESDFSEIGNGVWFLYIKRHFIHVVIWVWVPQVTRMVRWVVTFVQWNTERLLRQCYTRHSVVRHNNPRQDFIHLIRNFITDDTVWQKRYRSYVLHLCTPGENVNVVYWVTAVKTKVETFEPKSPKPPGSRSLSLHKWSFVLVVRQLTFNSEGEPVKHKSSTT